MQVSAAALQATERRIGDILNIPVALQAMVGGVVDIPHADM
jgi:hypothetical protein